MPFAARTLALMLVTTLLTSCGGFAAFVSSSDHQTTIVSVSGTVSIVQLTIVNGNTTVTVVTLLNGGLAATTNFCGNLVDRFPMGAFVNVNFNPGTACATLVTISISG
jgi:hypothetical protein